MAVKLTDDDLRELGLEDEPTGDDVPYLTWDEVRDRLKEEWEAGEHVSIVARTGQGKSHLIGHLTTLCASEELVLIDTKSGGDPVLNRLGRPVKSYPPPPLSDVRWPDLGSQRRAHSS
jgi:hypothetical protein